MINDNWYSLLKKAELKHFEVENGGVRAADALEEFLKKYEKDKAAQNKENKKNFWIAIITATIGLLTLIATVLFGILK